MLLWSIGWHVTLFIFSYESSWDNWYQSTLTQMTSSTKPHHYFHQLTSPCLHNKQFSIFWVNYFPYFIIYLLSTKFFQSTFFPSINFWMFFIISSMCLHIVYHMNCLFLFYIFILSSSNYHVFFLFRLYHIIKGLKFGPIIHHDLNQKMIMN